MLNIIPFNNILETSLLDYIYIYSIYYEYKISCTIKWNFTIQSVNSCCVITLTYTRF